MEFVSLEFIIRGGTIEETLSGEGGGRVKKHAYRCNRCLVIEDRVLSENLKPWYSAPCSKCGGLSIRLPISESIDRLFQEIEQGPMDQFNFQHLHSV